MSYRQHILVTQQVNTQYLTLINSIKIKQNGIIAQEVLELIENFLLEKEILLKEGENTKEEDKKPSNEKREPKKIKHEENYPIKWSKKDFQLICKPIKIIPLEKPWVLRQWGDKQNFIAHYLELIEN